MDNLGILIQAILSLKDTTDSKNQIAKELPKLESQLQSDKNTRVKIVAGLDVAKSKDLIQSQLNTLANQAKAPTIKVGIDTSSIGATQNITNSLKNIQTQAQQTASAVNNVKSELIKLDTTAVKSTSFKMGVDKDGVFNLEKTIENARNTLSKFGKVDLSWLKDSAGEVTAITAKITDATGAVERFHYALNEGAQRFDWTGSAGTDSGVEKLITSMQKAQDKVKALRTNLTTDLKSIRSAWQDVNGGKSVKSDENIERLKQQYIKVTQAIRDLRKADDTALASMKANADAQIDKLNQMVTQYHNAEKVATQLRAKGFETVKIDTGNNIDKFVNSINNSKVPIQAMQTEINKLTSDFAQLDTIQDQAGKSAALTNILNTLDNAKTKFQSLKELFKGFGNADWISVNSEQINKINDMATKIAIYKNNLTATRDEWKSQGIYVGEIQTKVTSLARSLPNIKKPEKFNEWVQEWNDINQKANQLKTNLDSQVTTHNRIYEIQSQIAKLNPTKDSAEIARLNEKLSAEQKTLSNLQMQSNVFSNLVSLEQQEQYITEQTVKTRDKLLSATNTGVKQYQSSITSAISDLQGILNKSIFTKNASNPQVTQTKQEITQLIAEYQKLMIQMQGDITPECLIDIGNQLTKLNADFNSVTTSAKSFEQSLKDDNGAEKFKQKVSILTAQIKEFQKVNSKSLKKYGDEYNRMLKELTNPNLDARGLERIRVEFQNIRREINTAGLAGKDFFGRIKEQAAKFASWMTLTGVISSLWRGIKKMTTNVIELDDAMTNLKKVTDETEVVYSKFLDNMIQKSRDLKINLSDLIEQSAEWAKKGYSIEESQILSEASGIYSVVGEVDNATAVQHLTTVMKTYNMTVDESIDIIDKFNNVSNKYGVTAEDIGEIMSNSITSLKVAGNSLDESIAMGTAIAEITGDSSEAGTALKILSMRLRGASTEIEAMGESTDGMAISTSKLREKLLALTNVDGTGGFDILTKTGEFKSTYEIMQGISEVWEDISSVNQAALLELIAGKQRGNTISTLLTNMAQANNVLEDSLSSSGSAMKEYENYLDSITGKIEGFKAAFQALSSAVLDDDFLKNMVETGTNLVNVLADLIKNTGGMKTAIAALAGGYLSIKHNVGELLNTPVYAQPQLICA